MMTNPTSSDWELEEQRKREGEGEDTESSKQEPDVWPEPGPAWVSAKEKWQEAWPLHVYLFVVAFLLISLVAAFMTISGLKSPTTSFSRTSLVLTLMVLSFSLSRALFLILDPYFSVQLMPFVAARLLWSLPLPGFTASFSIMLLILLDTTKLSLAPPKFQNVVTVMGIWFLHVVIVGLSDLLIIYAHSDMRPALVACQLLFVLYGLLVALGYGYVGVKMHANIEASSGGDHADDQTKKVRRLVVLTFVCSGVAVSIAGLNLYTAFSEFGAYSVEDFVQPWPFWAVQTVSRILEVAACSLVLYLFFRSGKGGHFKAFDLCCPWRHQRSMNSKGEKEENTYTVTVSGFACPQNSLASTPAIQDTDGTWL